MRVKIGALAGALALFACTNTASPPPAENQTVMTEPHAETPRNHGGGATGFALDLYQRLGRRDGNIFISPVSLSTAFALAYAGARGETAEEMARVLRFPSERDEVHGQFATLLRELPIDKPGRKLTIANAIWVQQDYPLRAEYRGELSRNYRAEPYQVDFFRDRVGAAAEINRWVEANTAGLIDELMRAEEISPDTRLALTNAVYFKGDWLRPFNARATQPAAFHAPGGPAQTAFMHQTGWFRHLDQPSFQAIELPYEGEELSMLIFLPKARDGLGAFEAQVTPDRLSRWTQEMRAAEPRRVDLAIPKLKLEERYQLVPALEALGIRLAFSNRADFSGITDAEKLKIDDVVHVTFLEVDEEGTEAAAATGITIVPVSSPPPAIPFKADHPFFFLIRDNRSGAIVFLGRIETPPATAA